MRVEHLSGIAVVRGIRIVDTAETDALSLDFNRLCFSVQNLNPVFSQGVMGDGYAVNPTSNLIVAPAAGTIALIQDTMHAFMLRTDNGGEVLVHIGIDTVDLNGEGFTSHAKVGDKVEAGAPIIEVDWEAIKDRIPSKETMVMVTNTPKFNIVKDSEERRTVNAGDHVAEATKK